MSDSAASREPTWIAMRRSVAQLEEVMREEGIQPHTPLGLWSRAIGQAMDAFAAVATSAAGEVAAARAEVSKLVAVSNQQTAALHRQLEEACKQVQELKQSGETHLRFQEKLMERERESAIHRFVKELTKDLQQVVFKELKEKLPLEERRFYYYAAWRRIFLAFVAAGLMGALGFVGGSRETDKIYQLGVICQRHLQHDPKKDIDWCPVTSPPPPTEGQNG